MPMCHYVRYPYLLAGFLFFVSLGGRLPCAPTATYAQDDSLRSLQPPADEPAAPAAAGTPASRELFRQHCVKCHGADGAGKAARARLPEIPDFTDASWQAKRSEAQLLASILDGKRKRMPAWRSKISEEQVRGLVAHVRAFAPVAAKSRPEQPKASASTDFADRYRRLQQQLEELRRQYRKLSEDSPGSAPSEPPESRQQKVTVPSSPAAAAAPAVRELFRQHCVKCHETDGTGKTSRSRLPEIPDFTDASWQAKRSDAQLLASIFDGKRKEMPPWRGKINEEQARALVAHVRSLGPATEKSQKKEQEGPALPLPLPGQEEQQGSNRDDPAEAKPARAFLEKLIHWLGKFHPAAVHFPIALLTSAALAALLRMATGNSAFDAVTRFCVWLAALTAVVAASLGWFRAGLNVADTSWILTAHRWLGTSTVTGALLALVLSEKSCRPDRHRVRMCFRVTLFLVAVLALVTGFFGGGLVFGLDHYTWPQ